MNPFPHPHKNCWAAFCSLERNEAINLIKSIADTYGFITDYKMYSDLSLMLQIELPVTKVSAMFEALKAHMTVEMDESSDDLNTNGDTIVFLNVTLTQGHGDLRIEVPAVPG